MERWSESSINGLVDDFGVCALIAYGLTASEKFPFLQWYCFGFRLRPSAPKTTTLLECGITAATAAICCINDPTLHHSLKQREHHWNSFDLTAKNYMRKNEATTSSLSAWTLKVQCAKTLGFISVWSPGNKELLCLCTSEWACCIVC